MFLEFALLSFALIFFAIVFYLLVRPMISGAIYAPTGDNNVEIIKKLAEAQPAEKMVDLGSGNGKIVIAFAKDGIESHGYEINPLLVWFSRRQIKKLGLQEKAFIHGESFWKANLSEFDVVTVFTLPHIMRALVPKIKKELKPSVRVIANAYGFRGIEPLKKENQVFLYESGSFRA
jgi:ribosomal protein L11 methylase PrmA